MREVYEITFSVEFIFQDILSESELGENRVSARRGVLTSGIRAVCRGQKSVKNAKKRGDFDHK